MTDHERAYLDSVERQLWEMSQLACERGEPWPLAEGGENRDEQHYWVDYNHLCVADPQIPHRPFRLVVPADAYDKLKRKYERLKQKRKDEAT